MRVWRNSCARHLDNIESSSNKSSSDSDESDLILIIVLYPSDSGGIVLASLVEY